MGGINIWRLLIIAFIVILLFGTRKLSTLGSDLGSAIKGFKKVMSEDKDPTAVSSTESTALLEDNAPVVAEKTTTTEHQA